MLFSIEVNLMQDGYCEASCSEMGLSAKGKSLEEVLRKMQNMLVFYISTIQEAGLDIVDRKELLKQLNTVFEDKNFILPDRPKIH